MYDMLLKMEITGFYCNSWPILTIKQNNIKVFEQPVINNNSVNLSIANKPFTIGMENKSFGQDNVWDTTVDEDGNIIADKYIQINTIAIDDVEFEQNLHKIPYHSIENGKTDVYDKTIRFNGYWDIDLEGNPYNWLIDIANHSENTGPKLSYFSDYNVIGNFKDHYSVIDKIRKLISR